MDKKYLPCNTCKKITAHSEFTGGCVCDGCGHHKSLNYEDIDFIKITNKNINDLDLLK